jgi:hypothetical protein
VLRLVLHEGRRAIDRARIEWVVVAGQEIDGNVNVAERLDRPAYSSRLELVALEDVAGDNDELRAFFARHFPDLPDGIDARLSEPRPGLRRQEISCHAELPVGGVKEPYGPDSVLARGRDRTVGDGPYVADRQVVTVNGSRDGRPGVRPAYDLAIGRKVGLARAEECRRALMTSSSPGYFLAA